MSARRQTTTLSDTGQVNLPEAMRARRGWAAGDRLVVEERPDGVLITREPNGSPFPPTRIEDVWGMLKYDGPPISIADMNLAIGEAAVERYRRSRPSDDDDRD